MRSAEPGPHCPADLQSCHDHTATCPLGLSVPRLHLSASPLAVCPLSSVCLSMDPSGPKTLREASPFRHLQLGRGRRDAPVRTQCFPGRWNPAFSLHVRLRRRLAGPIALGSGKWNRRVVCGVRGVPAERTGEPGLAAAYGSRHPAHPELCPEAGAHFPAEGSGAGPHRLHQRVKAGD